jgi:putative ABC transport system permease protein
MLQDLKYTLRLWAGRPWHTGFAIAALAIGIGANTGVFSGVNGLLLRSLPFREPDRLALLRKRRGGKPLQAGSQQSNRYMIGPLFEAERNFSCAVLV